MKSHKRHLDSWIQANHLRLFHGLLLHAWQLALQMAHFVRLLAFLLALQAQIGMLRMLMGRYSSPQMASLMACLWMRGDSRSAPSPAHKLLYWLICSLIIHRQAYGWIRLPASKPKRNDEYPLSYISNGNTTTTTTTTTIYIIIYIYA